MKTRTKNWLKRNKGDIGSCILFGIVCILIVIIVVVVCSAISNLT